MKAYRICLLPGDGIGPEVVEQTKRVLEAMPLRFEFTTGAIGYGAYQQFGTPLPEATLQQIRSADATLFGAVTTPPNIAGYFSPVVRLRQALDLYANLRPCQSIPHSISRPGIDLLIVRENTEGLYSGIERLEDGGQRAVTERVITRRASERIVRKAFELAVKRGQARGRVSLVTVVHKANVLRLTDGLFRQVALEVAADYPAVQMQEMLVDTCAMELVRDPAQFDVLVTTNLFGDILSDEAAMLVGGLGLAYSGNIGEQAAVFEPVHGSAPKLVGTRQANPLATVLAAAMLLDYLGEAVLAGQLRQAVMRCISMRCVTTDLGGSLTTAEVIDRLIEFLPGV